MVYSKREFFRKGVGNQVRPDIVIEFKRKPSKQIDKWNEYQRYEALKFLEEARKRFDDFIEEIKKA
jgi:hypothetical protein